MTTLSLIHEDAHLLVVNKPPGLLSVPGRGDDKHDCVSARVQLEFPDALVVHRLDMATSGLMLMARSAAMQRDLGRLFELRDIHKAYIAVVDGCIVTTSEDDKAWQLIDLPIAPDWPNRPLRRIDRDCGKSSQTRWKVLSTDQAAGTTRVALQPLTGRSHQLRVHLKAIGHPILGDALYAPPAVQSAAPRLLLHASQLAFNHPVSGSPVRFECPADF